MSPRRWKRGGRSEGRSRGRGGCAPQISSPAPPLGDVIVTIHHNEIETPTDQDDTKSRITNSQYLTSYNFLGRGESKIIVPGEPPKWTPLSESNPPTLQQDRGTYYRDQNAARHPTYPLEPMVQAILTDNPEYPVSGVDIIGCNNTMCNLLRFALGDERPFRILVEVLGKTVFFIRRENSPTETIPNVRGYGHTFPEAYTTWSASASGSESHQRVMEYEFAGMQCLVRYEADGFLPDMVPGAEKAEETPVPPKDVIDPEKNSSSMEDERVLCVPSATTELEAGREGRRIPQCAIFDLKTRSRTKDSHIVLREELPRLWISQTPNFILAHHTFGQFKDIRVQDVRDDVKQWEEIQQPVLGKFASLLQMIVAFARGMDNGKLEIEREEGDYCDVYLTHDSMSVRKAHNSGRNHLRNVVDYYQQIGQEKAQSVIDSITSSYAAEGQQAPNMMPPGAFPPPFGFPGHPGMPGMPPPPFGIPPPGAPGAPGMLPRMSNPVPTPHFRKNKAHRRGSHHYPGHYANQYLFYLTAPGAHGLPFPPPFPNAGTPPTGGFPLPLPNMPQGANLPIPPPGGFPNFPVPPPGAAGFPPMPMHGQPGTGQPGMGPGGPSPIPTGPRGLEGYPPPPGGGNSGRMDQQW
ncbi:hypothetical protein N7472_002641 [Penicillium cf. griseofulvum]|uniref:U1 small nuclear ribonucleoprotein C n=1 Tax=Penicillium cf. griseofulvum TaxID=2972120 RepID=A0A9W9T1P5_9EURO|nr:hypothetical protein N7472_002641 [Penicillium cf. griseofulvum]